MAKDLAAKTRARSAQETHVSAFSVPHAIVIVSFVVTGSVLVALGTPVRDVLFLLSGLGAIGAAVVVSVVLPTRRAGRRIARLVEAYLRSCDEDRD